MVSVPSKVRKKSDHKDIIARLVGNGDASHRVCSCNLYVKPRFAAVDGVPPRLKIFVLPDMRC